MTKKIRKTNKTKPQNKTSSKTNLPNNVTEEEFLRVLDNISKRLSHKFRFAYHDIEDMKQQAAIFAIEGLEKYDQTRPLENFLWTHVRNRLFNYKRNNYQRPDKPCLTCPFFDKGYKSSNNQCSKYLEKLDCDLYKAWHDRNEAKKNIVQPSYINDENSLSHKNDLFSNIADKEIIDYLDANIDSEYREHYLKLKHGIKVNKQHLDKLKTHIMSLISEYEQFKDPS